MAERPLKYEPAEVAAALREAHGLKHVAARRMHMAFATMEKYIADFPQCKRAWDEARGYVTDIAEGKLFEAINRGEPWAIQFYLRAQAKDRGYGDTFDLGEFLREKAVELARARNIPEPLVLEQAEKIRQDVLARGR